MWRGVFVKEVMWLGWVNLGDVKDHHATTTFSTRKSPVWNRRWAAEKVKNTQWWCSKVDEISTIPVWFFLCVPFLLLQNEPILIVVAKYQRECMPIFIYDSLSMSRMHPLFNTCLSLSVCVCIYLCVSVYTFVTCFEFSFRCVRINCVKCYA